MSCQSLNPCGNPILEMVGRARRVRRTVLVHVGTVVVLTTGETTTTGMLPVLADTTLTGRDVATAVRNTSQ
jgi:hypothetical protein